MNNCIHFVNVATTIHNGFYDYSGVIYKNDKTKVEIICPIHGSFWQIPNAHKRGQRCPKCAYEKSKMSLDAFIRKAQSIHGKKYDYSKVIMTGTTNNVEIVCPKHGSFFPTVGNHINKTQPTTCPRCAFASTIKHCINRGYNTFVKRSQECHGDRYDYSKVDYKGAHIHIEIVCDRHGSFWQTPANHYSGHDCAQCAHEDRPISIGENMIFDWLTKNSLEFQREKMFDDLINPKTGYHLRYDFFVPFNNILIEFDGEHHFVPIRGNVAQFEKVKKLDILKTEYASKHNIHLIRISDKKLIDAVLENHFIPQTM
jgi:hypothetical protein